MEGRWCCVLKVRPAYVLLMVFLMTGLSVQEKCNSLEGKWYNQLGSEMILTHKSDGSLTGEYRTAVEREEGSAGSTHSQIAGAAPYENPGAVFAFSVMYNGGNSTSGWTGQCVVCDEGEVLLTTWLLREQVSDCVDKWRSTRIGQDVFTRHEQVIGPRKDYNVDSPRGGYGHSTHDNYVRYVPAGDFGKKKRSIDEGKNNYSKRETRPCALEGTWYNGVGSEMILGHTEEGTITGEYRTAVEREKGAAGTSHSDVYGIGNFSNSQTTFAFFVVWNGGKSATGWVGQCHICGLTKVEVLEVTWLLRQHIDTCQENWQSTFYGESSFTRNEQIKGPRKSLNQHTPGEAGEARSMSQRNAVYKLSLILTVLITYLIK